jgi:hypothetical protein
MCGAGVLAAVLAAIATRTRLALPPRPPPMAGGASVGADSATVDEDRLTRDAACLAA